MNPSKNLYKGILYIIASAFFFALMNALVRFVGDVPSIQKSFFRNFVAFLGSLLILKPEESSLISFPALIGFTDGIAAGFAYTIVKKLGELGEKGPFVVMCFSGFSCLITLPYLIFKGEPMTWMQLLILLLAGVCAALAQFSITAAYFHAPAKEISVYEYSQIIFAAILGYFMLGQVPDLYSWIGYFVICLMAVLMFLYNNGIGIFRKKAA